MSVHLFILYWGMLSFITPPVALGAFAAASIAGASALKTGFKAMQLGSVIYFIPFFFVLEPALIMQGSIPQIVLATSIVVLGITLIAGGLQGYMPLLGMLDRPGVLAGIGRALIVVGGILVALPGLDSIGIPVGDQLLFVSGLTLSVLGILASRRRHSPAQVSGSV
jgi:TRAP-type uncharacterized transport system fused permease subunit